MYSIMRPLLVMVNGIKLALVNMYTFCFEFRVYSIRMRNYFLATPKMSPWRSLQGTAL